MNRPILYRDGPASGVGQISITKLTASLKATYLSPPRRRGSMESWTQIEVSDAGNHSSFGTPRPALSGEILRNSDYIGPLGGLGRRDSISYHARPQPELRDEVEGFAARDLLLEQRTLCDKIWRSGSFLEQMLEAKTHLIGPGGRVG